MRLQNKSLVIIGGTTGLGLSAAKAFLSEGARVVVVGRSAAGIVPRFSSTRTYWPTRALDGRKEDGAEDVRSTPLGRPVLQKPFDFAQLEAHTDAALAREDARNRASQSPDANPRSGG